MAILQAVLGLMAACILLALLARALRLPYAVVLILAGMALAFAPGVPRIALDPELALAFFLPPLLMGSAYRTDWQAFRRNLRPILLLAVGCVVFTAFALGAVARLLVPDLPWAAALALGAILAPPDAVAAAAVLQRLNLPRRIVTVLEGESLVNDASALVLYRLAIVAATAGSLSPAAAVGSFLLLGGGGILVGYAVARFTGWALRQLEDTLLETALSFLAAFASFLLAEELGLSGVMATVTCGIWLGRAAHRVYSARTRLEARAVWDFVEFALTSLVFILIGLQVNAILSDLQGRGTFELAGLALAISLALIALRFLWVFPAALLARLLPAFWRDQPDLPWQQVFVLGWSGMRGVVSLAVALALPIGFPERDLLVFLAFCAILATLVVQGTTLEWVIRRLRLTVPPPPDGLAPEEATARQLAAQARLRTIEERLRDELYGAIAADLLPEYRDRHAHLERVRRGGGAARAERAARRALRLEALEAARVVLRQRHDDGELPEEFLVKLNEELDLEEGRVKRALG
ncbi:Na+/H+ antiporter [Sabulicella rubraurantiaca]|uniref:Na+/H+ antiporter n=1 Tax=Sabulicella rubraurantiaca TaxID=2811429 RepID=UPI001A976A84|nr:Na+/H+ antiporter [Sabulicella rubraurantiaca]